MRTPSHPSQHPKASVRESVARHHAVPNGVTFRASLATLPMPMNALAAYGSAYAQAQNVI